MKEFLSRAGKTFTVRSVDDDDRAYDELMRLGCRTVPVTVIGTHVIRGFDAVALAEALKDGD